MSKILLSFTSITILIVGALLIVPGFIDWSQYKTQIVAQVKKSTGYEVVIDGELRAGILPTPHVTLNKVSIDSAGAPSPVGFKGQIEKASVSVALIPLLSKNIQVTDITLISPVIELSEQKQTAVAKPDTTTESSLVSDGTQPSKTPAIQLDNVTIANAKISYTPLSGDKIAATIPNLNIQAGDLMGPYAFDGRVQYNQFDVALNGKTGAIDQTKPIEFSIAIDDVAYDLSFAGLVDIAGDNPEIQGELALDTPSMSAMAAQFGATDLPIKDQSFAVKGFVDGSPKLVKLNNGQVTFGNAPAPMPFKFDFFPETQKGSFALQNIPGQGSLILDIAMDESTSLSGDINIQNIKTMAVDWLGAVDEKTFDNPQIPNAVQGDVNATIGDTMALSSNALSLGDYNLRGLSVTYKAGAPATVDLKVANFEGAKIAASGALDMAKGITVSASHPNAAKFIQVFQKDFQSSPVTEKSFDFKGLIKTEGDMINVENMVAKIGAIDAKGRIAVNNAGEIPSIVADMVFGNLDTQALTTGTSSVANTTGGVGATKAKASSSSKGAPWTRDAIDTSALRAINIDLTAKADRLVHGAWLIANPSIDIDLQNGVLDINTIQGALLDGTVAISGRVDAKVEGQPLVIESKINADTVNLSKFVKTALSQNKERVVGAGSFDLTLNTQGLSSSALIYGLNANGKITTSDLIVKGIDLAKVTEAISDESLSDLAAVVQGAFKTGQTPFEPIEYDLKITEGTMPVDNFMLVSPTAKLISNGTVSFARWEMDLKNTVDFTNPDDLPSVDMTIKGPLDAPKQSVASDVLKSFIMNKYGTKIKNKLNDVLGDKLKDTPAAGLINNLLGLPTNDNAAPSEVETDTETAPAPKLEEQLIRGLFNKLGQ